MTQVHSVFLAFAHICVYEVLASPQISFPVNSQVPPVAYESVPFSFTFSEDTFTSDSNVLFSLAEEPSWLQLDSATRTFTGTPTAQDVGDSTFQLAAADSDGEISTSVTLVVRLHQSVEPGDEQPLLAQLSTAGSITAPSTVSFYPNERFSLTASPDIFIGVSSRTQFYAVLSDNTPLPSWLHFDSTSLSFSGVTPDIPSSVSTHESYNVNLIASDVAGFSEAVMPFHVSVATHIFSFQNPLLLVSVVEGEYITIGPIFSELLQDGNPVTRTEIASVSSNLPEWLALDETELRIQGLVPHEAHDGIFTISVRDMDTNEAAMSLEIRVLNNSTVTISKVSLGNLNVWTGVFFTHSIGSPNLMTGLANITADLGEASAWLSFLSTNMSLQGLIPVQRMSESIDISFTFSRENVAFQVASLRLDFTNSTKVDNTTGSTSDTPVPTVTASSTPSPRTHFTKHQVIVLVLGIVLTILVVSALIFVILAKVRKRRKGLQRRQEKMPQRDKALSQNARLGPGRDSVISSTGMPHGTRHEKVPLPQVKLPWAPDSIRQTRDRLSKQRSINQQAEQLDERISKADDDDRLGELTGPSSTSRNRGAAVRLVAKPVSGRQILGPADNVRRLPQRPSTSTKYGNIILTKNNPVQVSEISEHSAILDIEPSSHSVNNSWQTITSKDHATSPSGSVVLNDFPQPPRSTSDGIHETSFLAAESRSVGLSHTSSVCSLEPLEIRRQHFHTQRARDKLEGVSRFSNGSTPRAISLTKKFDPMKKSVESELRRDSEQSTPSLWSQWSGVVTALQPFTGDGPHLEERQVQINQSRASSCLFDDAISSHSVDINEDEGDAQLHTNTHTREGISWHDYIRSKYGHTPPPLQPRESDEEEEENIARENVENVTRPHLDDRRKHVSVESSERKISQRSFRGSVRFL